MSAHSLDDYDDDSISENAQEINKHRSLFLTISGTKPKSIKSTNRGEATLLDVQRDETPLSDSDQNQPFPSQRTKSVRIVDNKHHSRNTQVFSPDELDITTQNMQSSRTKTNVISSPIRTSTLPANIKTKQSTSKIPVRSNVSRSSVPTTSNRRVQSSTKKGAFYFFNAHDHPSQSQDSPFIPIAFSKKSPSTAGHTPSVEENRKYITSSDDDLETSNLKEDDLKIKLKEEKRHGKRAGELLHKLHESYEELLEKYAHAENTIDQLRFQPRINGDHTPRSNTSEHTVHFIQQPKMNTTTLRSSGVYSSTTGTPVSSIRPVPSTTTTTTSHRKSISPNNSGTVESLFFDEAVPQQILVQEFTTPEIYEPDLLIQTKALGETMKLFLTSMDTDELSLGKQKQVYEDIKQDYEKVIQLCEKTNHGNDIDLETDLNSQLETMKHLLKEIVQRLTQNLSGKSNTNSATAIHDESHSSQLSARSSLCNHNDLMDQYQKLLNAVNTRNSDRAYEMKSQTNGLEPESRQLYKSSSHQSDLLDRSPPTKSSQKPYVYVSGDSDDDQEQSNGIAPISLMKGTESTSFELDYIPSTSVKHHQQTLIHGITATARKKKEEYDNLDDISKSKRKTKKITNDQSLIDGTRYSTSSNRTRFNDYDSGIGTNSTAKFSRDSKLYTSTMDETQFQSLYEEQKSPSSASSSSSRSSGSGSTSPGSPYSKYTKRLDSLLRDNHRRKPSGYSDSYPSYMEKPITGSFDPQATSYNTKTHRSDHNWKPQRTVSHHRRSPIENHKRESYRPFPVPHASSKMTTNQDRNYQQTTSYPQTTYKSSLYINQAHTHRRRLEQTMKEQSNNLYLDPQTGIVYGYESNTNRYPIRNSYQPSSKEFYRCAEYGSPTTYHHHHHINSRLGHVTTDFDDLGYESENKKRNRRRRLSSSDSDSDESVNYLEMIALNDAYAQAEKLQYHSQSLTRHITRQLRLVLASD